MSGLENCAKHGHSWGLCCRGGVGAGVGRAERDRGRVVVALVTTQTSVLNDRKISA